jgi:predicted DNA-binding WGR domain protein
MDYSPLYAGPSQVQALREGGQRLSFALDLGREQKPSLAARVAKPLLLRDALLALYGVLSSERKRRDRTDYLQYLARTGGSGSAADKKAQAEFLAEISNKEPEPTILDPVVTVHPDEVAFEVFSKDESTYARLSLRGDALQDLSPRGFGSTTVEFSEVMRGEITKIRSAHPLHLSLGEGKVPEGGTAPAPEQRIPDSWLRAFLQVQSASLLAGSSTAEVVRFSLEPVDLYNILVFLRLHSTKSSPRALRYELIPGEPVRMVLEPWGEAFSSGMTYTGTVSQAIRTWGRVRLRLLDRLLPLAQKIEVVLLGSALPSFYVLHLGAGVTFTLGLSGWTANDWSQGALFDLMVGWDEPRAVDLARITNQLEQQPYASLSALVDTLSAPESKEDRPARVLQVLQSLCRRGFVTYDIASQLFRYRQAISTPLDPQKLRFRSEEEALAYKLLDGRGAVELTERTELRGEGLAVAGRVIDRQENRSYQVSFLLDTDGRMRKLKSEGPAFRDAQGAKGPDAYLMALRLHLGKILAEERERQKSAEGRNAITEEVRTLRRRDAQGEEEFYRVVLERDVVEVHWGKTRGQKRNLRLHFNSVEDARDAYFSRLEMQRRRGFLEEG